MLILFEKNNVHKLGNVVDKECAPSGPAWNILLWVCKLKGGQFVMCEGGIKGTRKLL